MSSAILDRHGQPLNPQFNWKANRQKSLEALLGILNGLVADHRLDEDELLVLDNWLREQEHLKNAPDVIDLLDCTTQILADGKISQDELDDAKELIHTVLQFRTSSDKCMRDAMNHLLGMVQGVIADRQLVDEEIASLQQWLASIRSGEIIAEWPGQVLHERIASVLADGVITEEERQDLLETLRALVGEEPGAVGGTTRLPVDCVSDVAFPGRNFCLTGKFAFGSRKRCEAAIRDRGGAIHDSVVKELNYLVLGAVASRDWAHTSFGRKIEKAVAYKAAGCDILIISEEHWVRHL
ncbi:MAG: hypothetical protein M0R77_08815 [Gammaproteobacteria bacterium]|nr:hypothetical protein [Gammaproteobacteria bacterium]